MAYFSAYPIEAVRQALSLLHIKKLALIIHEQSFPSLADEDIGRGSLYSSGAQGFLSFISSLGFTAVQLGPQGQTGAVDPSPYLSTVSGKNFLSLAINLLMKQYGSLLMSPATFRQIVASHMSSGVPDATRCDYQAAWKIMEKISESIYAQFLHHASNAIMKELQENLQQWYEKETKIKSSWLERYSVYEILSKIHKTSDWHRWNKGSVANHSADKYLYAPVTDDDKACSKRRIESLLGRYPGYVKPYILIQFLLVQQHRYLRAFAGSLGLQLYGDLHVGYSHKDIWARQSLFLKNYALGAPPSRTNPAGQPWGYPVLDPEQLGSIQEINANNTVNMNAFDFFSQRIEALFDDFDGIRIDHPQGLVCPWVYRITARNPYDAVAHGARLYESPYIPGHTELARYARVRADQITRDSGYARYGDDWVVGLESEQVNRYAQLIDVIIQSAQQKGKGKEAILCEVLSTWPYPLRKVMEERELGRFCITQKADPENPRDIYRIENTRPYDWVMLGNHDTKPLWSVIEEKWNTAWAKSRARMLTDLLEPDPQKRETFYNRITTEKKYFYEAFFAELFCGPAQQVAIFFTDLLGIDQIYNAGGEVNKTNWSLRLASDYKQHYRNALKSGQACSLARVLAMALSCRKKEKSNDEQQVIDTLTASNYF